MGSQIIHIQPLWTNSHLEGSQKIFWRTIETDLELLFLSMDFGWNWIKNVLTYNDIIIIVIIIVIVIIIIIIYLATNFVIFVQWVDVYFGSIRCLNCQVFPEVIMKNALLGMSPQHRLWVWEGKNWNSDGTTYRSWHPMTTHAQDEDLCRESQV